MQCRTADKATVGARQEYTTGSHFGRLTRASHRRRVELFKVFLLHRTHYEWCPDGTRSDSVDSYPFTNELVRKTTSEGDDSSFRACIIE